MAHEDARRARADGLGGEDEVGLAQGEGLGADEAGGVDPAEEGERDDEQGDVVDALLDEEAAAEEGVDVGEGLRPALAKAELTTISTSRPGMPRMTSPMRMISWSIQPPAYPASRPRPSPMKRLPSRKTMIVMTIVVRAEKRA